jgi:N6-adenosine-specific RNA methylase IME4
VAKKRLGSEEQQDLFKVGPFVVTSTGLRVNGRPPAEQWALALANIAASRDGVQWAVGDMLAYADERKFGDELVESAMEATGYTRGTLLNLKSMSKSFPPGTPSRRSLSWSHHALVAGFDAQDREGLIQRSITEKLSWEALRAEARSLRHARRVATLPWPDGTFGVLMADVPWQHEFGTLPPDRATENHYPTMSDDEIAALAPRVQAITAPNAVLYFWATNAKLVAGAATTIVRAWGFEPRAMHTWVKDRQGLGYWVRNRTEPCIIAVRGNAIPPEESLRPDSVITSNRGMHSEKPAEIYEVIERCYAPLPKVELFARQPREGWTSWGNELLVEEEPARAVRLREGDVVAVPA